MQDFNFSKTRYITIGIFVAVLFFSAGIYAGLSHKPEVEKVLGLTNKNAPAELSDTDFSSFWKAWNTIDEKYPGADAITKQERIYGAISGLMSSLNDPYSVFMDPEEAKSFNEEISGNFSGVGMEVGLKDDVLTVIAPLKDTPAERAGIKAGDKILKINGTSTTDMSAEKAVTLIRGEKGTEVTLTILHAGDQKSGDIKIIRDTINIPTLDTELRSDGIFVIKLYSFSANASQLFRDALKEFGMAKTDKLLLDLRGNPGGYLDAAVYISSWFLPEGKVIVSEDYGGDKEPEVFRSKGYDIVRNNKEQVLGDKLKFVILIDGGSASASEIVAGAMQDHKRAILVGDQSFGKGSVQQVVKMASDTLIKITIAKWLTPNGNLIAETGLTPDYSVKYVKDEKNPSKDNQLDKAIQLLNNWPGIK